jgi:hypothetical protein
MASTSLETAPSTSDISTMARKEKSGYDQLPKEMHEMKIRDEKVNNHDEKVNFLFELICFFLLHKQFPNFFSQYYAIIYMYEQFFLYLCTYSISCIVLVQDLILLNHLDLAKSLKQPKQK